MSKISNELLEKIVEGLIFASHKPLSVEEIVKIFDEKVRPSLGEVRALLTTLQTQYQEKGVNLQEVASGSFSSGTGCNPMGFKVVGRKTL